MRYARQIDSDPSVEAGTQPTANITWPTPPGRATVEAGEVDVESTARSSPGWCRRQLERVDAAMADISEKTKVTLQIGAMVTLAIALVVGGKYWGTWENERVTTTKAIDRHEADIRQLRDALTAMDRTLLEIRTTQNANVESINTAVRQTTFLVTEVTTIRAALTQQGVDLPSRGD